MDVVLSDYITLELIDPGAVIGFASGAVGRIAQLLSMTFWSFLLWLSCSAKPQFSQINSDP